MRRRPRAPSLFPRHTGGMDIDSHERQALLRLVLASGPTAPRRRLLLQSGSPQAALDAGVRGWQACGLNARQIAHLRQPDAQAADLQRCLAWLQHPDCHLLGWHDPDYPPGLRELPQPPVAVFVQGNPAVLWQPAIAIIGSRAATAGGCDHARHFAQALASRGLAIGSGLAAGIDTAAHLGALQVDGGGTYAVLGTGPDIAYPSANAALQQRIAARGAVLSEFPPGTGALREHFPRRNRLLAGLCLAVLVVEAAERSGALITARLAADHGRDVFALPGSLLNPQAQGCHRLIREGAILARSVDDIVEVVADPARRLARDLQFQLDGLHSAPAVQPVQAVRPALSGNDTGEQVWTALGHDPVALDVLMARTALDAASVSSALLLLELQGRVRVEHGRYCRH